MSTCPNASHSVNHTGLDGFVAGICAPCHYSCLFCSGPSDSECTSCYPDSQLKSISTSGMNLLSVIVFCVLTINNCCVILGSHVIPELYCYPHELVRQMAGYEHWSVGVELALAFNLALVMALVGYVMCTKKSRDSSCVLFCCRGDSGHENHHQQGDYSLLTQSVENLPRPPLVTETIRPSKISNATLCDNDEAV